MQFSAKEDIEAPIDFVFSQLTDFQAFERSAMRRDAEIHRVDDRTSPGVGMAWDVMFELHGRMRELKIELTELDSPNGMVLTSRSPAMDGDLVVDLVALARGRTRLSVDVDLRPKNLTSRLFVQSLKLARSNLNNRYDKRIAGLARDLEDRFKRKA